MGLTSDYNSQLWKYQMKIMLRADKLLYLLERKKIGAAEDEAVAMLIISTGVKYEQLQTVMVCI